MHDSVSDGVTDIHEYTRVTRLARTARTPPSTLLLPPTPTTTSPLDHPDPTLDTTAIMSDDWDAKLVIGHKARAPKVTRTTSDLNGMPLPVLAQPPRRC